MRLPRMTTRRWMVAVAIVAMVMGGVVGVHQLKQRRAEFLARAEHHAQCARSWRETEVRERENVRLGDRFMNPLMNPQGVFDSRPQMKEMRSILDQQRKDWVRSFQLVVYHAAMARKCRRAARYPWLPVEPDPPKPQ